MASLEWRCPRCGTLNRMRAVVKDGIAEVLDEHPKCRNPKCQLQRFSKEYQALVAGYKDLDGKGKEI